MTQTILKYAVYVTCVIFMCITNEVISQSKDFEHKFGIFAGNNFNFHNADFSRLPEVPNCCPQFDGGTGSGFGIGLLYERAITKSYFVQVRGIFADQSAELSSNQIKTINIDGVPVDATIRHFLDTDIKTAALEPSIGIKPLPNLNLSLGISAGIMMTRDFSQVEQLVKPDETGTFENGLRKRNEHSGEIPESNSFILSAIAGASYDLPMNADASLVVSPEIGFRYGLSAIVKDSAWSAYALSAGIAVKYAMFREKEKQEIKERKYDIDTITIEKDDIANNIFRKGKEQHTQEYIDKNDLVINLETITRTDTLYKKIAAEIFAEIEAAKFSIIS